MTKELIHKIEAYFINNYKTQPILVFSPGRINLIGEHTDYNDGFVFPAAINLGIVSAIAKSKDNLCSVFAIDLNESIEFSLENILPLKKGDWRNYVLGIINEIQKTEKNVDNFNLVFGGNIPSGAGMSSSAALENSIVYGLNELLKLGLSKKEMIFISQQAEYNFVGVKCGIMDQYASMFGQQDSAILLDCQNLNALVVDIDLGEYEILLINTNVKHSLAESAYNERRSICEKIASLLNIDALRDASEDDLYFIKNQISEDDFQKALFVIKENNRVLQASKAIKNNEVELFGKLLYASHDGLQNQYKVSCDELDFLVENTKENPYVLGARMMGGGFGGCTINLVKRTAIDKFSDSTQNQFKNKFNRKCDIYNVRLSQGTHTIKT